ncbi:MAG: hypothetical protein DI582_00810 [Azospirillum brasilense]|nr:MAG: hypothetical protein DI582_00810 [Azospirillum brasilense]
MSDTPEKLLAALNRANEVIRPGGRIDLNLRHGEKIVDAPTQGITGFGGKDFTILAVDVNHNGKRSDPEDRVVVAAGGVVFTANMRGEHTVLQENPELAAQIQRSFSRLSADLGNTSARELGQLTSTAIREANAQEKNNGPER